MVNVPKSKSQWPVKQLSHGAWPYATEDVEQPVKN